MLQQVLIIHGGDTFDTYEEFLDDLKNKKIDLERFRTMGWKSTLGKRLGSEFAVYTPGMPNKENAKYDEWEIRFETILPFLKDGAILIGHSLGGIFLAKYLSENTIPIKVSAVFLIAAPFHAVGDFVLPHLLRIPGIVAIYHSTDDAVVPFTDATKYAAALPSAELHTFENRGHFNDETFQELEDGIRFLSVSRRF